ncbi:hypothetical protein HSR122_2457 [Halapricum desulfuricans]|uniref:Small CPxCG-related zinc finger protein n=1 Tax=Halapricum desulfuricans TaxID=2841257 RepID=A0A897NFQ6_9EURY|nr:hypothetical protein HSR122_2457 [Halapricum desulfuricans]
MSRRPTTPAMTEPVMCPECGWTGTEAELEHADGVEQCPVCDTNIEFVE